MGSRDPERARTVAEKTGASAGATYADAAANADVVILTGPRWRTRWPSSATCPASSSSTSPYPYNKREREALEGRSTAELIQERLLLVTDGDETAFASRGPLPDPPCAPERAVFEIGSITKVFTSLLLAIAVERGELGVDDPLVEHLPRAGPAC